MIHKNINAPKILVIGDLFIDHFLNGVAEKISPEAPVPVVNITNSNWLLGGAGNVVNNLKAMGATVDLLSVVGGCENTAILNNLLKEHGLRENYLLIEKERRTGLKTRVSSSNQQIVRFDIETTQNISNDTENLLLNTFYEIYQNYDIVILSDYNKGVLTHNVCKKIIDKANQTSLRVLVDPKGKDYKKYTGAYLLTPNMLEASLATDIVITDDYTLNLVASKLKYQLNLAYSIITLSERGIAVFDSTLKKYPSEARAVYDITGAGDTVIAALGYALANGNDIYQSLKFANVAAAVVVQKVGTATATLDEINIQHGASPMNCFTSKIQTEEDMVNIMSSLRTQGKSVVFTNGCFDIIHSGHIFSLQESKNYGDVLVVGLNSDASVKLLKGEHRPINSQRSRAVTLAGLSAVDYVVIFNDETPEELVRLIRPDVLTKGKDYEGRKVAGAEWAKQVKLTEIVIGESSTAIIEKLKKSENH